MGLQFEVLINQIGGGGVGNSSDTEVLFNNAGVVDGSADLTWNNSVVNVSGPGTTGAGGIAFHDSTLLFDGGAALGYTYSGETPTTYGEFGVLNWDGHGGMLFLGVSDGSDPAIMFTGIFQDTPAVGVAAVELVSAGPPNSGFGSPVGRMVLAARNDFGPPLLSVTERNAGYVKSIGTVGINIGAGVAALLHVLNPAISDWEGGYDGNAAVVALVEGRVGQTADLLQGKLTGGSTLFKFDKDGKLTAAGLTIGSSLVTLSGHFTTTGAFNPTFAIPSSSTWTFPSGGGTLLTSVTAHDLLSATHGDTTAGTVARGDLITGQGASAKWVRLAKGTANQVLAMDGTATDVVWSSVSGTGDVLGPASAVDGHLALFDGTTGKLLKDGGVPAGGGTVTNTGTLTANRLILGNGTVDVTALGSLGTTTTLLHGNAAGAPTFAAVSLTADVSGILPIANGGTNASSASITAFNNITGYTAAGATGTTSTNLVFSTSPTITTPTVDTSITFTTSSILKMQGGGSQVIIAGSDSVRRASIGNSGIELGSGGVISWSANANGPADTSKDSYLARAAAATFRYGLDVNGAAVSQTLQAANGITGTDKTGGNFTLASGKGTGAGAVSSLIFQTPTVLGSGTTAQSLATRLTLDSLGLTIPDAHDIMVNATTGTKIGTATTQKLGFYGATPIVQGASVADATDAGSAITQLNALISRLEATGLIATV